MVYREISPSAPGGRTWKQVCTHRREQLITQSQVGAWIRYSQTAGEESRERVAQILAYYQNRYGAN